MIDKLHEKLYFSQLKINEYVIQNFYLLLFLLIFFLFGVPKAFAHEAIEKVEIPCGLTNVVYHATEDALPEYIQWVTYGIPLSIIEKHFSGQEGEFTVPLSVEIDAGGKIWKKAGVAVFIKEGSSIKVLNSRHARSFPIFLTGEWIFPITITYPDEDSYKQSFDYNINKCSVVF